MCMLDREPTLDTDQTPFEIRDCWDDDAWGDEDDVICEEWEVEGDAR